uniref:HELICc domain containing protein n=2 Tax=uncultured Caudovirales phage TaxID=2100421 RepID=A0A6J5TAX7_9CAUD|nr:HELICc domain containing protein [uncultured Caudovirales phage]
MILAPVGAGKTAITLTAMTEMVAEGHVKRWLVLAPKRVCTDVWPVERLKWAPNFDIAVAIGSPAQRQAAFASAAPIVVTNYDNIQSIADLSGFDGVVFDELTRLKNPSGKRFKALLAHLDKIPFRWGLTGSFTSNGLEDVFGQCKVIDQTLLGRAKGAFLQKYFVCVNRDFGDWQPRKGALEQVMGAIRPATFVLDPGAYSDKLPQLNVVEMRCDMPDRKPYEKMKRDLVLEYGGGKIIAANAAAVTNKLQQMASGFVYDNKMAPSEEKGKFTMKQKVIWFSTHKFELIEEILNENQRDNTIIVYNYKEELAELQRRYPHARTIDDFNAIERWNKGEIELLLIHPKSAGHGLNLQFGGCKIVFLSLPWSLELFEQTVGRLHRGGQTKDVWCYLLICNKTIDERIWGALQDKRAISDIALEELTT